MTAPPKTPPPRPDPIADEPPPLFRSWGRLYTAVLIFLTALIVIFYLFQVRFT